MEGGVQDALDQYVARLVRVLPTSVPGCCFLSAQVGPKPFANRSHLFALLVHSLPFLATADAALPPTAPQFTSPTFEWNRASLLAAVHMWLVTMCTMAELLPVFRDFVADSIVLLSGMWVLVRV